jgi:hypothetical protein
MTYGELNETKDVQNGWIGNKSETRINIRFVHK